MEHTHIVKEVLSCIGGLLSMGSMVNATAIAINAVKIYILFSKLNKNFFRLYLFSDITVSNLLTAYCKGGIHLNIVNPIQIIFLTQKTLFVPSEKDNLISSLPMSPAIRYPSMHLFSAWCSKRITQEKA